MVTFARKPIYKPHAWYRLKMPKFHVGQVIKVPKEICPSGRAQIVGAEDATSIGGSAGDELKRASGGYAYYIADIEPRQPPYESWPIVSERQIEEWKNL